LFGLIDLFVVLVLIRWLFQTPGKFLRAFWQAGRFGMTPQFGKDKDYDPIAFYKVFLVLMVFGLLAWGEQSLFY
jgi:hypothetical protein